MPERYPKTMRFLSLVGNSFGCSASGERLVSAARDGDIQEAKALLDYNPRLVRYSTFGVRNSPLHYSAAQGHHEIVTLLLESGVDINLRNYRGQTALMQACQYGHWEVVQTLVLFRANIHRADYLNGGTALHLAALNGHSRCIRLLLADYIPSIPNFCNVMRKRSRNEDSIQEFDDFALHEVINRPADGGIIALHMAALNGHVESLQLLLDLGASVTKVTVEDGTTIDLIGAGSTPLHYAACGGNAQCCHLLISRGASLNAENANGEVRKFVYVSQAYYVQFMAMMLGSLRNEALRILFMHEVDSCSDYNEARMLIDMWTPLMVARSWHRDALEEILSACPERQPRPLPSSFLCLPLMSIMKIARECGWRTIDSSSTCLDPCVVCLERKCTVAAEGCFHEFCTHCALYLCSTSSTSTVSHCPPGSIPCPLCRHGIVSFVKLADTMPIIKEAARMSLSLPFCSCTADGQEPTTLETPFCKPDLYCSRLSPLGSSFRSLSCQKFPALKFNPGLCMGTPDTSPSLVPRTGEREHLTPCSRSSFRRSTSNVEARRWLCSFSQSVETGSSF